MAVRSQVQEAGTQAASTECLVFQDTRGCGGQDLADWKTKKDPIVGEEHLHDEANLRSWRPKKQLYPIHRQRVRFRLAGNITS